MKLTVVDLTDPEQDNTLKDETELEKTQLENTEKGEAPESMTDLTGKKKSRGKVSINSSIKKKKFCCII